MLRPLRAFRLNPERSRWEIWTPYFGHWQGAEHIIARDGENKKVALMNDATLCPCTVYPGEECSVLTFAETQGEATYEDKEARWFARQQARAAKQERGHSD